MRKMQIGDKYGKLTLVEWVDCHRSVFLCDCGNMCVKIPRDVKFRKTQSCGCIRAEKPNSLKHGESGTKLYLVHKSMKQRCNNKNNKDYPNYGGRGIVVCGEWNDYTTFKTWALMNRYQEGLCIDRIDNSKGYSPDNCRWITNKANCNNTQKNNNITFDGKTHTLSEWAEIIGISKSTLSARLNSYGWSVKRALTEPA
jgi:hypothetical protein